MKRGDWVRFLWPRAGEWLTFDGLIEFISLDDMERKVEVRHGGALFAVPREHIIEHIAH